MKGPAPLRVSARPAAARAEYSVLKERRETTTIETTEQKTKGRDVEREREKEESG